MDEKAKPVCEYGAKCYRLNPTHLKNYFHPPKVEVQETAPKQQNIKPESKRLKLELKNEKKAGSIEAALNARLKRKGLKQTKLDFIKKDESKSKSSEEHNHEEGLKKEQEKPLDNKECTEAVQKKLEEGNNSGWTYMKKETSNSSSKGDSLTEQKSLSQEAIIKTLFLVDMPSDFYSFYEFCKKLNSSYPVNALKTYGLTLVGPFDVLAGDINITCDPEKALCHWRFYFDLPEFQTVLSGENTFHLGYWRDDPQNLPVFVASNKASSNCVFKIEAENLFGAVHNYLQDYQKTCNPFLKVKTSNLIKSLEEWTEENKFILEKQTDNMKARQKNVVSKTFHRAGLVVPVEPKTELGYRPLLETDSQLKKICSLIMKCEDSDEQEALWENLQVLITAANIANDECDFGNSLELGIDLFCMGSPIFHDTVEHLMTTAYSLLNRTSFGKIIKTHLSNRRSGSNMSIL